VAPFVFAYALEISGWLGEQANSARKGENRTFLHLLFDERFEFGLKKRKGPISG
jgi:hypothetical protein